MKTHLQKRPIIATLILVIGAALLGVFTDFAFISLTWFRVMLMVFIGSLIWCIVAVVAILRLIAGFLDSRKRIHACISFLILAIGLALAPVVFWVGSQSKLFFHLNKGRYEEVAEMVLKGQLEQKGRDFLLPQKYSGLSASRSVWLYRRGDATDIMFLTAGLAGEVVGYVYSSDGKTPLPGAVCRRIPGAGEHWYCGGNQGCRILPEGLVKEQKELSNPVVPQKFSTHL